MDSAEKKADLQGRQITAVSNSNPTVGVPTDDQDRLSTNLEEDIWCALIESLHAANACGDSLDLCQDAVEKFPSVDWFRRIQEVTKKWHSERTRRGLESLKDVPPEWERGLYDGGVLLRPYPWMTTEIANRESKFVLENAQMELQSASSKCTIRRTSVPMTRVDTSRSKPDADVFGLFLTQDVRKNEIILIDKTDLCATNPSDCCQNCCDDLPTTNGSVTTLSCCGARYCSQDCLVRALRSYHHILCGKDFSFIKNDDITGVHSAVPGGSVESLFWVRLLGIIVQESAGHPLKTSIIARTTRQYSGDFTIGFNLNQHVATPIRILQTLGIDIFANSKFDAWVLHTIRVHYYCNYITVQIGDGEMIVGGKKPLMAMFPLYVFQNHSCEPTVHETFANNGSTMTIRAQRDMKAGEEMKSMYLNHIDGYKMTKRERQAKLMPWFAGPCRCERCEREVEGEEEAAEFESRDRSSGINQQPL